MKKIVMFIMVVVCLGVVGLVGCNNTSTKGVSVDDVELFIADKHKKDLGVDGQLNVISNASEVLKYREIIKNKEYKDMGLKKLNDAAFELLSNLTPINSSLSSFDESLYNIGIMLIGYDENVLGEEELRAYVDSLNDRIKDASKVFKYDKSVYSYLKLDYNEYKDYYYYINQ